MPAWRVPVEARSEVQFPRRLAGTVEIHRHASAVLRGNPWDDPTDRDLPVYLPPGGARDGLPLLVLLSGYSGSGHQHFQRGKFLDDSLVGRLDRLIRTGAAPPALMVGPDCLTSLGGSQYLNSSATGRYADYVTDEIVPWVRRRYGTGPTAVLGTSSGGYGAISLGLGFPEVFGALASNAGDAYFEYCYPPDFPIAFRVIRRAGGPEAFLRQAFEGSLGPFVPSNPRARALSTMAYASAYSPIEDEPGRFDLPFDLETGALRPEVWARWLARDPVRFVAEPRFASAARRIRLLYVDAGAQDEFGLDVSARIFAAAVRQQGAAVDFEEYEGTHFDRGHRYDLMFPRLLSALGFPAPGPPL
ncbi:MAG TPA: alpha/beta hydrolase-fold protein [Thermoplasmata archaeon]|nr:alpha/beta hydrolase-fold protein [Thermoplasmata archaeon]